MTSSFLSKIPSHDIRQSRVRHAVEYVAGRTDLRPKLAVILGSGLGDFADQIEGTKIPSSDIPHMPPATAPHHKGNLIYW